MDLCKFASVYFFIAINYYIFVHTLCYLCMGQFKQITIIVINIIKYNCYNLSPFRFGNNMNDTIK